MLEFFPILQNVALFEGLEEQDLTAVFRCLGARTEHYSKNTCVFLQGETVSSFGILLTGRARVQREDVHGNQTILTDLAPGDLFAEAFVCAGITHLPVTVWTTEDSTVLFMAHQKLMTTCSSACTFHSRLIANLLRIMAVKLVAMNRKVEILQKGTIREKLIAFLEAEMRKSASPIFTVAFSRQEMAEYIGANRSAVSRELSQMRDEGLIDFKGNTFKLLEM